MKKSYHILVKQYIFFPNKFFFYLLSILLLSSCAVFKKKNKDNTPEINLLRKYREKVHSEVTNYPLYKFIESWEYTPHCMGGKSKECVDCSGFTCILMREVYQKNTCKGSSASIYKSANKISKNDVLEGDLVFFKINQDKISHVGVYLQNQYFVHASTKSGVVISSLEEPYYKKYFVGFGRLE